MDFPLGPVFDVSVFEAEKKEGGRAHNGLGLMTNNSSWSARGRGGVGSCLKLGSFFESTI